MIPVWPVRSFLLAASALVLGSSLLSAQANNELLELEVKAFQAVFADPELDVPHNNVGVSPLLAADGAPGSAAHGARRPDARTAALARMVGAKIVQPDSALKCEAERCHYSGVDAIIVMTKPRIAGDSAYSTVTAHYNSPHGARTEYVTVRFVFSRHAGQWHVARSTVLGRT